MCVVGYFLLWGFVFVWCEVHVVFVSVCCVLVCTTLFFVVWVVFHVVRLFVVSLFECCLGVDQLLCIDLCCCIVMIAVRIWLRMVSFCLSYLLLDSVFCFDCFCLGILSWKIV